MILQWNIAVKLEHVFILNKNTTEKEKKLFIF